MTTRVYVLVNTTMGHLPAVLAEIRAIPGIKADAVTGPFDIIVTVDLTQERPLGHLIANNIHTIDGVTTTITCLSLGL